MLVDLVRAEKGCEELRDQGVLSERQPPIPRRCLLVDLDVQRRTRRGWPEGSAQLVDRAHGQASPNHDVANITERGGQLVDLSSSVGTRPHDNILLKLTLRSRPVSQVVPSAPSEARRTHPPNAGWPLGGCGLPACFLS